jgi:hypothetical protein
MTYYQTTNDYPTKELPAPPRYIKLMEELIGDTPGKVYLTAAELLKHYETTTDN